MRSRSGEVDAEIRRTAIGRAPSRGRHDRSVLSFIGPPRLPPLPGTGRSLRVNRHAVGAMPERAAMRLPIVTLARGCARHCSCRYAQCRAAARFGGGRSVRLRLPDGKRAGKNRRRKNVRGTRAEILVAAQRPTVLFDLRQPSRIASKRTNLGTPGERKLQVPRLY